MNYDNYTQTLIDIPDYIESETINNIQFSDPDFTEDIINEDLLDDWDIDDFLVALPKSIKYGLHDSLYFLSITYNNLEECIISYYNKDFGKSILEVKNINIYNAFKEIYLKLKTIDKLN